MKTFNNKKRRTSSIPIPTDESICFLTWYKKKNKRKIGIIPYWKRISISKLWDESISIPLGK